MCQYMKQRYKNQRFQSMEDLRTWLHESVNNMSRKTIKSITGNHHYLNAFIATL
ncbi:hypothetical protein [Algibacter sp. L4_22]|uniref:hypothetical protein n=1 Tax=unclassified Algibacter TaxID=2615009 RepID=UPI0034D3563B